MIWLPTSEKEQRNLTAKYFASLRFPSWSSSLQCGKKKNCPTWKRKNQNHTIKVEQKVLISVVVTAQSKVSFVYGPGAVGFLPWWDWAVSTNTPGEHGEGRNLLPECNASRCHTALQHIDDSEVWSLVVFILNCIILKLMTCFTETPRENTKKARILTK